MFQVYFLYLVDELTLSVATLVSVSSGELMILLMIPTMVSIRSVFEEVVFKFNKSSIIVTVVLTSVDVNASDDSDIRFNVLAIEEALATIK